MQIILLEKVVNVGNLGDVVKVKNGYARNFLIPQGKAKRATAENVKIIEDKRAELEAAAGEAGFLAGLVEERGDLLGVGAVATHAVAEARVVVAPAAHLAHPCHDPLGPLGKVLRQPVLEQRRHLRHDGFHQHLLQPPKHAARQQHAHGQTVQIVFAQIHVRHCAVPGQPRLSPRVAGMSQPPGNMPATCALARTDGL